MEVLDVNQILQQIKQRAEDFDFRPEEEQEGIVLESADGIARVSGLYAAGMGELIEFPGKIFGIVFNLEREEILCAILDNHTRVREGMVVRNTGKLVGVNVGSDLLGRVINPLGKPLDGGAPLKGESWLPLERVAPGIIDREPVSVPLQTGYKAIDSLVPIGRGQRELIIGDRQTGKTTLAIDTIINQKDTGVISVYVAIGQKESTVVGIVRELEKQDVLRNCVIVSAPAHTPAILQYMAPFVGCAVAEYFMYTHKKHTLVIYDDLTKHAAAYRNISLLMRRPPGREAYPGDIFFLHARLLERAANLLSANGGGSMTALPIIETQSNDITAYIPTNVISITDGQIFLEADLFNAGVRPAVNVGISVSRVGGNAQTKAMRQVAGNLRIDLAQYREKEAFSMFSSELDDDTIKQLKKGQVMVELLKQNANEPLSVEDQVLILFVGAHDYFAEVPIDKIRQLEAELLTFFRERYPDVRHQLAEQKVLTPEITKGLDEVITAFKGIFDWQNY